MRHRIAVLYPVQVNSCWTLHIILLASYQHHMSILLESIWQFVWLVDCNHVFISVDGGWSEPEWSECSVTCGGGTQTSTRTCTNPAPAYGGSDCQGESTETQDCFNPPCPSELLLDASCHKISIISASYEYIRIKLTTKVFLWLCQGKTAPKLILFLALRPHGATW